jgi:hypothetical protein
MTNINVYDILDSIRSGEQDANLDTLSEAVRDRIKGTRAVNAANSLMEIAIGQPVRLKDLSPKYVNGLTAKVVGKGRSRFQVVLDSPPAGGRFNGTVTVPATCVEAIA